MVNPVGESMFKCDYSILHLSFNDFHDVKAGDMPEYDEFCLLKLKDGRHTAGNDTGGRGWGFIVRTISK